MCAVKKEPMFPQSSRETKVKIAWDNVGTQSSDKQRVKQQQLHSNNLKVKLLLQRKLPPKVGARPIVTIRRRITRLDLNGVKAEVSHGETSFYHFSAIKGK